MGTKKQTLVSYYSSINKEGRALGYNWNDMAALGLDDPREVFKLNQELIADGVLSRVNHRNSYGDSSLFMVKGA